MGFLVREALRDLWCGGGAGAGKPTFSRAAILDAVGHKQTFHQRFDMTESAD